MKNVKLPDPFSSSVLLPCSMGCQPSQLRGLFYSIRSLASTAT